VFRLNADDKMVGIDGHRINKLLAEDPEGLLSRYPVLCEGDTEAGFLSAMLSARAREDGIDDLDSRGVHFSSRHGQPEVLDEGDALADSGIRFALFVDNETNLSGRRASLNARAECVLGSWQGTIRNVEEAVAAYVPADQLHRLVEVAATISDRRGEAQLVQQLNEAAGHPGQHSFAELAQLVEASALRQALSVAMQAKQGKAWFKSRRGGEALGSLLLELGTPSEIRTVIDGFWSRIRAVLDGTA
jgi:hypothetical protein